MDIKAVFEQMLVLFLLLVMGYICSKARIVDREGNRLLSRFALALPQCCMALSSVININFDVSAGKIVAVFFSGFAMYFVLMLLGLLVVLVLHKHPDTRGLFGFMTAFGNVGFMGFPVISSLFGSQALFYAALFLVPFNLLAYSIGPIMLSNKIGFGVKVNWRAAINPVTVMTLFSIVVLFLHPTVPHPVEEAINRMGDCIVPLSMVIIGTSLGDMPLKDVFSDWRCYVFSVVKLIVVPVAVYYSMGLFIHDSLVLGTMTVLAGTPVAAVAVMISVQEGLDASLPSKTVFLSTVMSVLTIPLICWGLL